ncbi:hypothetical protein [Meiothermus granaticius]|uniref:Uncharacterized protein n=1 Tax=Meiothermus granaticius NBRC 107808 TaxID=1227551 RepID=A0A399F4M9_9DEIN|nr:hypothetical protein [Meiothermus granaticius]RIH91707.1 hypothetical protein Mgrana_02373 [Meiothermus granaticius NBRC 107808]
MPVLKENQAALKDWGEFLLRYPAEEVHRYHEVRSGVLWVWQVCRIIRNPFDPIFLHPPGHQWKRV